MSSHPFRSWQPPKIPTSSLRERADEYIRRFPDHWGKKSQLKAAYGRLRVSAFMARAEIPAVEIELTELLDLLDGLYLLHPFGPPSPDNPWNPVEKATP